MDEKLVALLVVTGGVIMGVAAVMGGRFGGRGVAGVAFDAGCFVAVVGTVALGLADGSGWSAVGVGVFWVVVAGVAGGVALRGLKAPRCEACGGRMHRVPNKAIGVGARMGAEPARGVRTYVCGRDGSFVKLGRFGSGVSFEMRGEPAVPSGEAPRGGRTGGEEGEGGRGA